MTGKQIVRAAAAVLLAVCTAFCAPAGTAVTVSATTLDELQQKQSSLEQTGSELDARLSELKNNLAEQQAYKDTLDAKIVNTEKQIDSRNAQIAELDAQIAAEEQTIAEKQAEADADYAKLKQRIYAIYLTGESSNLEIILSAKNMMELSDKAEVLKVISEHDMALVNALKEEIAEVSDAKAALEQNRSAVSEEKAQLEENEQELQSLSDEAGQLIATLSASEQEIASEQEQNRIDQNAAAAAVNAYLASYSSSGSQTSGSAAALSAGSVSAVLSTARQYLGCPYCWGACGPSSFDCSGFVSYVLKQSGWSLGGASRMGVQGLWDYCTPVSYANAAPGDLVFYDYTYGGEPNSHVGIYLGNGIAIQCDSYGGVEYASLSSSYWSSHLGGFGRLPS